MRAGSLLVGVAALGLACASTSDPPPLEPQTVTRVAPSEAAAPPAAEAPKPPPPSTIAKTIVIDPGGETDDKTSLVAAAEAERQRRETTAPAAVVINDENLKSKAIGQLTVAKPVPREAPSSVGEPPVETPVPAGNQQGAEDYWRTRLLEARLAWRQLVDEVEELESEVNLLRRRFYDEDDPYYRDSQIKPAWDRALDRLREARRLADEARELVASAVEDGRRLGALPGWLREGIELEPGREGQGPEGRDQLEEHRSREPDIYDPDDGDGGA